MASRGSAATDVGAGLGAADLAYEEARCMYFVTNEEQVVYLRLPAPHDHDQEIEHVSGNLRPALMRAKRGKLLAALRSHYLCIVSC
jgi:hypothetical protein